MSLERRKRASQLQRDERGRFILHRGPFAEKVVLTEEQANELRPILDDFYIWDMRLRRWMIPFFCMMSVVVVVLVGDFPMKHLLLAILGISVLVLVGVQISYMKQPWYPAFRKLHRELNKNAPRV